MKDHSNHDHHSDNNHRGDNDHRDHPGDHEHSDHGGHDPTQKHGDHQRKESHKGSESGHHGHHVYMIRDFRKRFWVSLALSVPVVALAPMIQQWFGFELAFPGDKYVQFALSSFIFFYGGWPFFKGLFHELRDKTPAMMTLISLAILVAYVYSSAVVFGLDGAMFFWELATLIVIMLLGHWIEMKSVLGASNALQELVKLMPSEARKINEDGDTEDVDVSDLKVNDLVLVRPGEKIPVDGLISEGESHINESMLTGESQPVAKKEGDEVIGGSLNENGTLKVEVKHTGKDSYLSKVLGMVEEAQKTKSKTQNLANRAAGWLFYVALFGGILTLITWLSIGREFEYALERMVTVMIISCPHALGLAIPLVVAISTSVSAKNGLLIRNRTAFENSRKITTIIFDKTGTLTKGKFGVTRYESVSEKHSDEDILSIASALEFNSGHPIAAGILSKTKELKIEFGEAKDFRNMSGKGIVAKLNGQEFGVVSPSYLQEKGINEPEDFSGDGAETVVFLVTDDRLLGWIALSDEIREESLDAIKTLKNNGIKVIMATGDNEQVARSVSQSLNLDGYHAQVLPEDKQRIIKDLQDKGEFVAMTGDGINDAPALAQANVGIAVGSGTDVAAETADIILVNSNPRDIAGLILFGKATYKKMVQNLIWATGYNLVAIPLAAGVLISAGILLSPAFGAVLMSMSTIIVAINAQLLKKQLRNQS